MSNGSGGLFRLWIVFRFLLGYASYAVCCAAFALLIAPCIPFLAIWPGFKHRFLGGLVTGYLKGLTRWYLPLLGLYRVVEISGIERRPHPAVYVANHRGYLDAPLLLGLLPDTSVVVKGAYARWPVIGTMIRRFDFVRVDRGSPASIVSALAQARALIGRGRSLLVFPEGTRAEVGRLRPFHPIAFRIARETGVPLVPVLVHSDRPFMAKAPGSILPRSKIVYRIRFLEPEHAGAGDSDSALCDRVFRRMVQGLRELDRGTVWEKMGETRR